MEMASVNEFDRFMRDVMDILNIVPKVVDAYSQTLVDYQNWKINNKRVFEERNILFEMLKDAQNEVKELNNQMRIVRKLVDEEKYKRKCAEHDRDYYKTKVEQLNLEKTSNYKRYSKNIEKCGDLLINATDLQTTGSIMADLSYTRDEIDFDFSYYESRRSRRETSNVVNIKKRRSSSTIRFSELASKDKNVAEILSNVIKADLMDMLDRKSNIRARAVPPSSLTRNDPESIHTTASTVEYNIKTPTTPELNNQFLNVNTIKSDAHNFQQKTSLKGGVCSVCFKRLKFSSMVYKCRDCKTLCHVTCKDNAPLPCFLNGGSTPSKVTNVGIVSDYTPTSSPMVPSIVVLCIKEIEERGLSKEGLYLVPGSDDGIKSLKTKLLRGKGIPNLSQIEEIDDVCCCLKDYFQSLKEPIATRARWQDFASAVDIVDVQKMKRMLQQIISDLPQPNRETLAYLVLHLKKIVESPGCKMTVSLLANVFGPIIIGYSSNEPENFYSETRITIKVMVELIELPKDYWERFFCKTDGTVSYPIMAEFPLPRAPKRFKKRFFETP